MLRIAIFEDNPGKLTAIDRCLEDTDHRIVAEAQDIGESFELLEDMARYNAIVDVLLLDGTLYSTTQDTLPVFEYILPKSFDEIRQRGLIRKRLESTPRIIRVDSKDYVNEKAKDAKAIKEVLTQLGSFGILATPPIIGISSEYLTDQGVEVDYDISSYSLSELPTVLAKIESEKH